MITKDKLFAIIGGTLGILSTIFFVFDLTVFSHVQPKMVAFEHISSYEEGLMNWVGVSLLVFLTLCLLTLYRLVAHLKKAKSITLSSLIFLVGGIVGLLCVFSDIALLSDIGKQYTHNLSQPEWMLVYPIVGFQLLVSLTYTYLHIFGFQDISQEKYVMCIHIWRFPVLSGNGNTYGTNNKRRKDEMGTAHYQ